MMGGKTGVAWNLLVDEGRGSVLPAHQSVSLDDLSAGTVLDVLKDKHPPAADVDEEALMFDSDLIGTLTFLVRSLENPYGVPFSN